MEGGKIFPPDWFHFFIHLWRGRPSMEGGKIFPPDFKCGNETVNGGLPSMEGGKIFPPDSFRVRSVAIAAHFPSMEGGKIFPPDLATPPKMPPTTLSLQWRGGKFSPQTGRRGRGRLMLGPFNGGGENFPPRPVIRIVILRRIRPSMEGGKIFPPDTPVSVRSSADKCILQWRGGKFSPQT